MLGISEGTISITVPFTNGEVTAWESSIRELFRDYCGKHSNHQRCSTALIRGAHYLHNEFNTRRGYLDALESTYRFSPRDPQSWGWRPLIDTPFLQVGLLSLYRFFSIPLHDHPNAWGVQQVVSGKLRIRQYQFAPDSAQHHTLVSLEKVSDLTLSEGDNSSFTPSLRSLHELDSVSQTCVVLSMMVNPYRPQDRSFYYQVPFTKRCNMGLYNRVRKRLAIRVALD